MPGLRASLSDFQAGISLLVYDPQPQAGPAYQQLLDRLVSLNVDSVSIVFPVYTAGVSANTVQPGKETPSGDGLVSLARLARARGLSVTLRPVLDEATLLPAWRGAIRPTNPNAWFASYGSLILSYASLAQSAGVQTLAIGTELNSMEPYLTDWRRLIGQVRQVYSGQVTYAYNFGTSFQTGLWPDLDVVSIDAYFPLDNTPASATADQMAGDWQRWLALIRRTNGPFGKPIVFTEVGVVPKTGAHFRPWDRSIDRPTNLEEQRAYYEATCDAAASAIDGIYWWDVGLSVPVDLAPDDYNPLGRPAEDVIRTCYAKIEGKQTSVVGLASR